MGKKGKEEKKRKKKDQKGLQPAVQRESGDPKATATGIAEPIATYSDGHPYDRVQYLEAKLILKPDRFTSVERFRDFGRLVQRTAKKLDVGFITDPEAGLRPDIREITFGDTPDFRLYN